MGRGKDCRPTKLRYLCLHDCVRGTNGAGAVHRRAGGNFVQGWQHAFSRNESPGFPKFERVDTWSIDARRKFAMGIHDIELSNMREQLRLQNAHESFGTVPLLSAILAQAINDIDLEPRPQLSGKLARNAHRFKTKLPILPIRGKDAKLLFGKLIRRSKLARLDFSQMALDWCNHVDGQNIWPTLPAYLRVYYSKWQKRQQAKCSGIKSRL